MSMLWLLLPLTFVTMPLSVRPHEYNRSSLVEDALHSNVSYGSGALKQSSKQRNASLNGSSLNGSSHDNLTHGSSSRASPLKNCSEAGSGLLQKSDAREDAEEGSWKMYALIGVLLALCICVCIYSDDSGGTPTIRTPPPAKTSKEKKAASRNQTSDGEDQHNEETDDKTASDESGSDRSNINSSKRKRDKVKDKVRSAKEKVTNIFHSPSSFNSQQKQDDDSLSDRSGRDGETPMRKRDMIKEGNVAGAVKAMFK